LRSRNCGGHAQPGATLHGDAGGIIELVNRYADAGVQHLVIEPFSSNPQDFLEQLERFAREIAPRAAVGF